MFGLLVFYYGKFGLWGKDRIQNSIIQSEKKNFEKKKFSLKIPGSDAESSRWVSNGAS